MKEKAGYLTELLGFAILDSNIREFRVTGPAGAFVSGANFMRLTTKGRFAVTAMIDLALRQGKGPVTLSAISERQEISLSYLEQLFGKLRRHQIVESVRGPGGGYNLARKAADVSGGRHHHRGGRTPGCDPVRRQGKLPQRCPSRRRTLHDA
jgi:hypothetical protein